MSSGLQQRTRSRSASTTIFCVNALLTQYQRLINAPFALTSNPHGHINREGTVCMPKFISTLRAASSVADRGKVRLCAMTAPDLDADGMAHPATPKRPITLRALAQARRIVERVHDDKRGQQAAAVVVDAVKQGRDTAPLADLLIVEECAVTHGLEAEC